MQLHMQVVHEHIENAYADTLEQTSSIQVFGAISDDALAMMRRLAGDGVQLIVKQEHLAGFTRSAAQEQPTAAG
jgi:hypothetical protein